MAIYSLFTLASGLIKMSVLLFYRRLSTRAVSPAFRWALRITWVTVGIYTTAFVIIPVVACRPISAFWDQVDFRKIATGYEYTCINEGADVVANGIVSTIQDFIVAFLPTLLFWNVQMPFRQKVALYGIFAVSYTTVVIGAMRTYSGYRIFFETYDITWVASETWLWSLLELHIGSMCANAPALKVFFTQFLSSERISAWTHTRSSRSRLRGAKPQRSTNSDNVSSSAHSGSTIWGKVASWKKSFNSNSTSSSRAKSQTQKSETSNSGVLRLSAHFKPIHTPRDSMTKPLAPEYIDSIVPERSLPGSPDLDIEMGDLQPGASVHGSDLEALPPLTRPESVRLSRSRPSSPFARPQGIFWDTRVRQYVWKPWDKDVREIEPRRGSPQI